MDFIVNIFANLSPYLEIAAALVGAFALIATMTKNEADNKIVDVLYKIINFLGANFGKAANAPETTETSNTTTTTTN